MVYFGDSDCVVVVYDSWIEGFVNGLSTSDAEDNKIIRIGGG